MIFKLLELSKSIHGELPHMGIPCVIVRFEGCNLSCNYCDAPTSGGREYDLSQITSYVENSGLRHVLITGGEPLLHMQQVNALVNEFNDMDVHTTIETNGTIPFSPSLQSATTVVMDVKLDLPISDVTLHNYRLLTAYDAVKFVFWDSDSLDTAIDWVAIHPTDAIIIFSPISVNYNHGGVYLDRLLMFKREFPSLDVRLQCQIHKVLHLP